MRNVEKVVRYLLVLVSLALAVEAVSKESEPEEPPALWRLDADIKSKRSALLIVGMSQESVLSVLGKPSRRRKKKKEIGVERWIYYRKVDGPLRPQSTRGPNGFVTIIQSVRFIDSVTIVFSEQKIESVSVRRREESDADKISPGLSN